jgi:hypothetical protein
MSLELPGPLTGRIVLKRNIWVISRAFLGVKDCVEFSCVALSLLNSVKLIKEYKEEYHLYKNKGGCSLIPPKIPLSIDPFPK